MSVVSETSKASYVASGNTTYAIPFLFTENSHVKLYINDVLKTLGPHYTVSGANNPAGGTLTIVGSPPSSGEIVVIKREVPFTQGNTFTENAPFLAATMEAMFNKLTFISQQIKEELSRSVKFPVSSNKNPQIIGTVEPRTILVVNSDGTGIEVGPNIDTYTADMNANVTAAAASATAAAASQVAAAASQAAAATSESNIADAEANCNSAATAAAASATAAAASATSANNSATTATTKANDASTSATSAAASQAAAATSATNAASSEATATTKASEAATSATSAASSSTTATTAATNAANSALAAAAAAASVIWNDVLFLTYADSPFTVTSAHRGKLLSVDCSSGNVVINLPQISLLDLSTPWVLGVKKTDSSSNNITLNRSGTDKIDSSTSKIISSQDAGATLIPDIDPSPDVWTSCDFGAGGGGIGLNQGTYQTGLSLSAATQISPLFGKATQTIFVKGNGGPVVSTNTSPLATSGMVIGQRVTIVGTDDVNTYTLDTTTNLINKGIAELKKGYVITYEFWGTDGTNLIWGEVGRNF